MKTIIIVLIVALGTILNAKSQNQNLTFTFTAVDSTTYVKLDSIKVMNRTRLSDIMIYWPDTTLSLEITPGDMLLYIGYTSSSPDGIPETSHHQQYFNIFQNYPNPVYDFALIPVYIPQKGMVNMEATDLLGRIVFRESITLDKGYHTFRLSPGDNNVLLLTAQWKNWIQGIKVISAVPSSASKCKIEYIGSLAREPQYKASAFIQSEVKESGITDKPETNKSYIFQFATNIPCLGNATVEYDGMIYNTIQIYGQCWLKQNMNVGTGIPGPQEMTDNGIIEKYCYNDQSDSCSHYGGLYQWDEAMQYSGVPGARGICPPGWHIPTDEEWKVLYGSVDSQFGIGDPLWDSYGQWISFDAGKNLKSAKGWASDYGTDLFGFTALPSGRRDMNVGTFNDIPINAYFWSSDSMASNTAWTRSLHWNSDGIMRSYGMQKTNGYCVRCIQDYNNE
jgi:uncharacterized protein (TIGR02145 family)